MCRMPFGSCRRLGGDDYTCTCAQCPPIFGEVAWSAGLRESGQKSTPWKQVSGTIRAHEQGSGSPDSDDLLAAVVAEPVGRRAGAATAWHQARFGRHRWPPSLDEAEHTWPTLQGCDSREPDHEADPGKAGSGAGGSLGTG